MKDDNISQIQWSLFLTEMTDGLFAKADNTHKNGSAINKGN
jgi:hypothetical protein